MPESTPAPEQPDANAQTTISVPVDKEYLQCRMYENRYPEVDDLVMVKVRQIAEMGAYVHLLEYNNTDGMILLSELSRRRIRSVQKIIRVGRDEVVVVLRVDKEKGYIDLSKRRVSPEEVSKCEDKYRKSKEVHSIMRHVAEKRQMNLEELYARVGWPLYRKYGHAYDAFKLAVSQLDDAEVSGGASSVFQDLDADAETIREMMSIVRKRMTPHAVKVRADIEVTCFGYEGIDAIKAALGAGEACKTAEVDIKIKIIAPPHYVMLTNCMDKQLGIDTLERSIAKIEEVIKKMGGEIIIKMKPRAVSESDDQELAALMEKVERENEEVGGDDEESDDEEQE